MSSLLSSGIDWLAAGGGTLVVSALVVGTMTPVAQALLHDPHFDPWLGGVIPISAVVSHWLLSQLPVGAAPIGTVLMPIGVALTYTAFLIIAKKWIQNSALLGLILLGIMFSNLYFFGSSFDVIAALLGAVPASVNLTFYTPLAIMAAAVAAIALVIAPALDLLVTGRRRALLLGLPFFTVQVTGLAIVATLVSVVVVIGFALPAVGLVACKLARRAPVSDHRHVLLYSALLAMLIGVGASIALGPLTLDGSRSP